MAQDQLEDRGEDARPGGGRFVLAGVVGALALGAGLGLWARPATGEREGLAQPAKVEKPAASAGRLQIVIDDTPAPIGAPLEVLPAGVVPGPQAPVAAEPAPDAAPGPMPMVPRGPPNGLMKANAPMPPPLSVADEPAPARPVAERKTEKPKPKPQAAKAERKTEKPDRKGEPARAQAKAQAKAKTKPEPSAKKPAKAEARKAPAEKPKAHARADRAEKGARPEKKTPQTKVAKAKGKPAVEPEAPRMAKLVKAVKTAPEKVKTGPEKLKARPRAAESAKAPKAEPKKAEKPKAPVKPKPVPRDDGSSRMARNSACASADPGEALVCADPRLNQRDRQLQRAYRDAEAAGVPASALRRQQERWRQARAAAARDGSWAVEDMYVARIAELNDLARDAREY